MAATTDMSFIELPCQQNPPVPHGVVTKRKGSQRRPTLGSSLMPEESRIAMQWKDHTCPCCHTDHENQEVRGSTKGKIKRLRPFFKFFSAVVNKTLRIGKSNQKNTLSTTNELSQTSKDSHNQTKSPSLSTEPPKDSTAWFYTLEIVEEDSKSISLVMVEKIPKLSMSS